MASPPYHSPATSPPYHPHIPLPNPKKRPSMSSQAANKRQKRGSIHSTTSALSAHPLRQTSFPPDESAIARATRSPSIDSDFTAVTGGKSIVTNAASKKVRGKGKKKQLEGSVKSTGREKTVDRARDGTAEALDDEEDDDDGGDEMVDDGDAAEAEAEVKKLAVLTESFNPDQVERWTTLRRSKLKKETVRKIVNQTVSQSVPPAVITSINGYTKTFVGTLVERAREVQQQWAALETPPLTPPKAPIDPTDFHGDNPNDEIFTAKSGNNAFADLTTAAAQSNGKQVEQASLSASGTRDLGPLLPDHFREALRRYKRDGEGGGTGLTGVSVGLGLPGSGSARMGGKRLFR